MSESTHEETSGHLGYQHVQGAPPAMERAEVLVDQLGARLGQWTNSLGNGLQRFWARTREEGEDIWAEANDIRERNHVGTDASDQMGHGAPSESSASASRTKRSRRSTTKAEHTA